MVKVNSIINDKGIVKFADGQELQFQNGTVNDKNVNGVQISDVVEKLIIRLKWLDQQHHDYFNEKTLDGLRQARDYQALRDLSRKAAHKEGKEQDWNPEI